MPLTPKFGNDYYFEVVREGSATIQITVTSKDGEVLRELSQEVVATQAPTPRCMGPSATELSE